MSIALFERRGARAGKTPRNGQGLEEDAARGQHVLVGAQSRGTASPKAAGPKPTGGKLVPHKLGQMEPLADGVTFLTIKGCGWCTRAKPAFLAAVARYKESSFSVEHIDTSDDPDKQAQYGAQHFPTTLVTRGGVTSEFEPRAVPTTENVTAMIDELFL